MNLAAVINAVAQSSAKAIAPRRPLTVSQWADAERILSSKQSPEPGRWRTARVPYLREPMDCLSVRSPVREVALMFPIQSAKALAVDTPIPTPDGWATMGDLRIGDRVFGADGLPATIVGASQVFHGHDCYRLTFSDGEQIVADAGHRWAVIDTLTKNEVRHELARRAKLSGSPRKRRAISGESAGHMSIMTTQQIAGAFRVRGKQSRYAIAVAAQIRLPDVDVPIDPYLFGVWLGDGGTAHGQLTLHEDDAPHIVARIESVGHHCRVTPDVGQRSVTVLVDGRDHATETFFARLRRAGVLGNKHIPAAYLRASHAQRMALLQGILDTDGHAASSGAVEVSQSDARRAAGIIELVRTLGFKPTVRVAKTKCRDAHRVRFTAYAGAGVFSLPRKLAVMVPPGPRAADVAGCRHIVMVEQVPTVPTRCIAVDSADHLFLCGRGFVPTHNTELAINTVGYIMDHAPCPVMVALPAEVSMNKWIAQKLGPLIDETPAVRRALTTVATRDGANRREFKDFAGGQLYLEHAGSPARLKSTSVKVLIVDEVDEFASALIGGDDPIALLEGRTSAFPSNHKRLYISTPQIQGVSRIEALWLGSDMRRYHVPCPHCGHRQPLEWAGLHWSPDATEAYYACRECGAVIDEHHKPALLAAGEWVAEHPERSSTRRGYHLNCLYYPMGLGPRWRDLARMWLNAQNDPAKLKTFVNDRLAEPWEDPAMRAVKHNLVADRAEPLPMRPVPAWVLAVTAGIDTQDNRLAVHIVGWGRGLASWAIDYVELPGDPAEDAVWAALTDLLLRPIERSDGGVMQVDSAAIDIGGHRTEAVKAYVRQRLVRRLIAIHGAVPNNAPVLAKGKMQDVNWRGKYDRHGVHTYAVGTVAIKHLLYSRLSTDADKQPDARLVRFSNDLDAAYFGGLTAEAYNPTKNRFEKRRGAPRNEPLDTWVYAYAATHHPELRLHRATRADWDAREARAASGHPQRAPAPVTPQRSENKPTPPKPRSGWGGGSGHNNRGWG